MKFLMLCCISLSVLITSIYVEADSPIPVVDYGDPHATELWQALRELNTKTSRDSLHIIQLGDSHTAGDYFTGRLREKLQEKFGNAGLGWITPGDIKNQRSEQTSLKNVGRWNLLDSKNRQIEDVFPLGGLINFSETEALIEVKTKKTIAKGQWRLSLWYQSHQFPWRIAFNNSSAYKFPITQKYSSAWQLTSLDFNQDSIQNFRLLSPQKSKLGGIIIDRNAPGITLDALGNNGSIAAVISRWDAVAIEQQLKWRNPKLIILAYGTNEAYDLKLSIADYETDLRNTIRRLRTDAPNAAILILGVPSGVKKNQPNLSVGCNSGVPPSLITVQQIQRRISKEEHTLYWDWMEFMGGFCGAEQWANFQAPLMRPDLIHLSPEGYARSADGFFDALMAYVSQ